MSEIAQYRGTGKRKTSVARVILRPGDGKSWINGRTLREQLERRPTEVLRAAVKGMLPKNRLAARQLTKLKIYAGPEHPHEAQAPKPLDLESS